ncbi:Integration host factor subunit beta [Castellaniella defragrans]
MSGLTKSELIAALAGHYPQLAARDMDFAVKTMLDAMSEALAQGQRIEIRGFGSFSLSQRQPRVGRNPKSGERVHVPAKLCALQARQGIARTRGPGAGRKRYR